MKTNERIEQLTALGFSLAVTGPVPHVEKCEQSDWPNIRFNVTVLLKGKPVIDSPFSMGVGHVDAKKAKPGGIFQLGTTEEENLLYAWQKNPRAQFKNKQLWAEVATKLAKLQKVQPGIDEVLYALMLDGRPFFDAQSFESWASDYGYDTDSRKAERIYHTCMETGRKLTAGVPNEIRVKVSEILADM